MTIGKANKEKLFFSPKIPSLPPFPDGGAVSPQKHGTQDMAMAPYGLLVSNLITIWKTLIVFSFVVQMSGVFHELSQ